MIDLSVYFPERLGWTHERLDCAAVVTDLRTSMKDIISDNLCRSKLCLILDFLGMNASLPSVCLCWLSCIVHSADILWFIIWRRKVTLPTKERKHHADQKTIIGIHDIYMLLWWITSDFFVCNVNNVCKSRSWQTQERYCLIVRVSYAFYSHFHHNL